MITRCHSKYISFQIGSNENRVHLGRHRLSSTNGDILAFDVWKRTAFGERGGIHGRKLCKCISMQTRLLFKRRKLASSGTKTSKSPCNIRKLKKKQWKYYEVHGLHSFSQQNTEHDHINSQTGVTRFAFESLDAVDQTLGPHFISFSTRLQVVPEVKEFTTFQGLFRTVSPSFLPPPLSQKGTHTLSISS